MPEVLKSCKYFVTIHLCLKKETLYLFQAFWFSGFFFFRKAEKECFSEFRCDASTFNFSSYGLDFAYLLTVVLVNLCLHDAY